MFSLLSIAAAVLLVVGAVAALYLRNHRTLAKCSTCGALSQFGYSRQAESSAGDIARLCLGCLMAKLTGDFRRYAARALVIEPAADLPCYVFQPESKWANSKLTEELTTLLANMESTCRQCGSNANFLWITSNGLRPSTLDHVFSEGPSQTLLRWGNARPYSVCGKCCLGLIQKAIESRGLTFLEVCGPGSENGVILPMGY
jgi:hypothetical protein